MSSNILSGFQSIRECELKNFIAATNAFGVECMDELARLVQKAFQNEEAFIALGITQVLPCNEAIGQMAQPVFAVLNEIEALQSKAAKHAKEFNNHFAAVAASLPALNWITLVPGVHGSPVTFIRDMREAGDYFGNRILTSYRGNELHMMWMRKWSALLSSLEKYVRLNHLTGFAWNGAEAMKQRGPLTIPHSDQPSVPVPPPPPPSVHPAPVKEVSGGDAPDVRQALMDEISQGVGITLRLRHVDLNTAPEVAPVAQKAVAHGARSSAVQPQHSPVYVLEGRKWRVEYQHNIANVIEVTPTDKCESVAMYKCDRSTLKTTAKMNAVTIDNCRKCVIHLQSVISSVELIRCEHVKVQCFGSCPNITLDSCDSTEIFLNDESASCEVISSKSTSTNVNILNDEAEFIEFPVPEQIKSVIRNGRLVSSVIEHM